MAILTITINTEGAAFEESPTAEVARILRDLSDRIEGNFIDAEFHSASLHDINGNNVGALDVEEWAE